MKPPHTGLILGYYHQLDAGTPFSVNLEAERSGGLSIVILPFRNGEIISGANPLLAYTFDTDQRIFSISSIILISSEYMVSILSIRNHFTLTINSDWSPFYGLKVFLYFDWVSFQLGY